MKHFEPFPASVRAVAEVEKLSLTNPELYIRLMGIVFTETYGDSVFGFFYEEEWRKAKGDLGECLDLTKTKHNEGTKETAEAIIKIDDSSPNGRDMRFVIFDADSQHPMVMAALKKMRPFSDNEKNSADFLTEGVIASADLSTLPEGMNSFIPNSIASNHMNLYVQHFFVLNPDTGGFLEEFREVASEYNIDAMMKALGPRTLAAFSDFFWLLALENVRKNPELSRIIFDYIGDDLSARPFYILDVTWGLLSDIERDVSRNYVKNLFETNWKFLSELSESRKGVFMETLLAQNNTGLMKKMLEMGVVEKNFEFAGGYELRELLNVTAIPRKSPREQKKSDAKKVQRQFTFKPPDVIVVPLKSPPKGKPKRVFRSQTKL